MSRAIGHDLDKLGSPVTATVLGDLSRLEYLLQTQVRQACLDLPRQVARHALPMADPLPEQAINGSQASTGLGSSSRATAWHGKACLGVGLQRLPVGPCGASLE